MISVFHKGSCKFSHFLLSCNILVLTYIKRQINAYILIDHSTAITFYRKSFLFKFIQITAYGLFRDVIKLAQLADHHSLFCL